ncbi:hypothetical protein LEP1GSC047_1075 [Leptospira inadai serovar Lyme str. 10]|uniref:Uncharacterized protein n=2 Tax=Leptospira inadai serovar Lyme TaxID=293084 RepID=V6HQQ3_9LEPT|nr:hypothetical protein LEP1GSC047_1075 [Leptospira inadai serovar Lyme str. 10]PNV71924.1 hypothetical protein BES34_020380 [Leptospira inadai serovar Lyme]
MDAGKIRLRERSVWRKVVDIRILIRMGFSEKFLYRSNSLSTCISKLSFILTFLRKFRSVINRK